MVGRVWLAVVSAVVILAALGVSVQTGETDALGASIAVVAFFWWQRFEDRLCHARRDAAMAGWKDSNPSVQDLAKTEGRTP